MIIILLKKNRELIHQLFSDIKFNNTGYIFTGKLKNLNNKKKNAVFKLISWFGWIDTKYANITNIPPM